MISGTLQTKSNHWYCVLYLKDKEGSRKQKWISTGLPIKGNKRKAAELLLALRIEYTTISDIARNSKSVFFSSYMFSWVQSIKPRVAESTFNSYSEIVNKSIIPYFDEYPILLTELRPKQVEYYYRYLQEKSVTGNTVLHHHAVIHKALNDAVRDEIIADNPASKVERPRKEKYVPSPYSREETVELLKCIKGHELELPISLAVFYGLRLSEIIGLCWIDINFEMGTLSVKRSFQRRVSTDSQAKPYFSNLKTSSSYRTFPLVKEIACLLKEYQLKSKQQYEENEKGHVLIRKDGEAIKPTYISRQFINILSENGLRRIRFHDLRHGCAGIMINNRVPLIEVQQWMGHSSISTTADMYIHLDFSNKVQSAKILENSIFTE